MITLIAVYTAFAFTFGAWITRSVRRNYPGTPLAVAATTGMILGAFWPATVALYLLEND